MEESKKRPGRPKAQNLDLKPFEAPTHEPQMAENYVPTNGAGAQNVAPLFRDQQRKFSTQKSFTHDLYKLQLAQLDRNIALPDAQPEYIKIDHVHHFHTITSDGKKQTRSTSIGGHFHEMEIIDQGKDLPPLVKCKSGPMKEVTVMRYGKRVKITVPINDVDHHTHEVDYERSNIILERQRNIEAAKAEAEITRKFQGGSVQGVELKDD